MPVRKHTIYTGASVFSGATVIDKLRDIRSALTDVSGLAYVMNGENRFFFLLVFLFCAGLVLGAAWLLTFRRREEERIASCFWWLSMIA